ncbi:hypothetical protein [Paenibacillus donghaensis]|uniref:Uncharacterized protein n=1 Tax=Paenibacillus donghaensis TaxID=414771 RepID=A0A2Z2KLQ3_9BACL|nr:hypothetical protein [Paenibacillus donghaensis]ASA20921.1 hypothetical protein B9T62_09070 [Paenibacillus donghaensis]
MFYLRKEPEAKTLPAIHKTDGTVIPERPFMSDDRIVYKAREFSRFYRGSFTGLDGRYQGMKVYTCKTLKRILELRETTLQSTGELFDVYDENGKVDLTDYEGGAKDE